MVTMIEGRASELIHALVKREIASLESRVHRLEDDLKYADGPAWSQARNELVTVVRDLNHLQNAEIRVWG